MPKTVRTQKDRPKNVPVGTVRIKTANLKSYEKTINSWKRSAQEFPEAMLVIRLFKASQNFKALVDKKDSKFLKGQLSPQKKLQGARVNILPSGKKLDKAFSLFAPYLTIHNQTSTYHWDVIYRNPGGTYSYLYTLQKRKKFIEKKYIIVKEFEKRFPTLKRNIYNALKDPNDDLVVPMYTLLKTYMRIGNETYYKANGHKGLTTLKKKDISIQGRYVSFNYISKDGVPVTTKSRFPDIYILRLRKILKPIKRTQYVFVNKDTGHPLLDSRFRDAFKRYCGQEFYPHIVRSYYATSQVKYFLKTRRSATKEELRVLFLNIAEKLGHRRFDKKNRVWKESYNVTVSHYIKPELVEKINKIIK